MLGMFDTWRLIVVLFIQVVIIASSSTTASVQMRLRISAGRLSRALSCATDACVVGAALSSDSSSLSV